MNKVADIETSNGVGGHEIILRLLEEVGRDPTVTQRRIADDFGVALGLVNAYFKRCVKKGLVKVAEVPARRYAYYLTPHGFSEKARLTRTYLTHSFTFFRNARQECSNVLAEFAALGWTRIALAGLGDLAEITILCAADSGVSLVAIVSDSGTGAVAGVPVVAEGTPLDQLQGIIVTDLEQPQETYDRLVGVWGPQNVKAPKLLRIVQAQRATP